MRFGGVTVGERLLYPCNAIPPESCYQCGQWVADLGLHFEGERDAKGEQHGQETEACRQVGGVLLLASLGADQPSHRRPQR